MFATKIRMTVALRFFLIAVILFNALSPILASAKSLPLSNNSVDTSETQSKGTSNKLELSSLKENNYLQRFSHPTSNESEKAKQSGPPLMQSSIASLKCVLYFQDHCSSTDEGMVLTETYDTGVNGDVYAISFKILCEDWDCPNRKIYYRAKMEVEYSDPWGSPMTWKARL